MPMSILDCLGVELLLLAVGPTVWPSVASVARSASRAFTTWSSLWQDDGSHGDALVVQLEAEDVLQGSSLGGCPLMIVTVEPSASSVAETQRRQAKPKSAKPKTNSKAKPKPITTTSLTASQASDEVTEYESENHQGLYNRAILTAQKFQGDLAKAQKEAEERVNFSRSASGSEPNHGNAVALVETLQMLTKGKATATKSKATTVRRQGQGHGGAAAGDHVMIRHALEKAHYFQMDLARAQAQAVLKQYYY